MADNKKACTGNCMACAPFQRQYCAAQITLNNMKMLNEISEQVDILSENIERISEKIEAIQNGEAVVFNPIDDESEEVTQ